MDTINNIINFFASYPTSAKVLMLLGILLTVSTAIFFPRKAPATIPSGEIATTTIPPTTPEKVQNLSDTGIKQMVPESFTSDSMGISAMINNSRNAKEFKRKVITYENVLPTYIKQANDYDVSDYISQHNVGNLQFDLLVYLYYHQLSQRSHTLLLIEFYEINVNDVNWTELNAKWENVKANINYNILKQNLANTNGFRAPFEYSGYGMTMGPKIMYLQVTGRREDLKSTDFSKMQGGDIVDPNDRNSLFRKVVTYDALIDGLKNSLLF